MILITGYGTVETAIEAIRAGAFDLLTKPLIDEELEMAIERALKQRGVIEENKNLKAQLDLRFGMENIVGHDHRMLKVFDVVDCVADTKATVLITGESGTGKSLIARAIHRRSCAARQAVRRSGLRRAARKPAGKRTVRPRCRLVHRRDRRQDGQIPAGRRRHDFSRRNRHRQPEHAGQAAARLAGACSSSRSAATKRFTSTRA